MIDPRQITPLLSNTTVDKKLASGPRGDVYLVTRQTDNKKLALKHLSIPTSESQTKALIYSGAVKNESQALRYYEAMVKDLKAELLLINNIKSSGNLLKFRGYQVDQKFLGSGYDVYLLSDYCPNLTEHIKANPLTKLQAINLAIDLCSALEQLRSAGLIHKDVHPGNVFLGSANNFLIGDLGVVPISELSYSSMPDALISNYTAPEVLDGNAHLNETMDVYSIGMVLYEIYNGGSLPVNDAGKLLHDEDTPLPEPEFADTALAQIILKACAYKPSARYQSPSDMKQALSLYLQRGDATNEYLVPMQEEIVEIQPEPEAPQAEEAPAPAPAIDADAIAAAVIAAEAAEAVDLSNVTELTSADVAKEEPEPEPVPTRSLNELGEDEPLLPFSGEMSLEDFMESLRKNTGIEVVSMDSDGNMSQVPGYESEETLPENTEFVESADNRMEIMAGLEEIDRAAEEYQQMTIADADPAYEPQVQEDPQYQSPRMNLTASEEDEVVDEDEEDEELTPRQRRKMEKKAKKASKKDNVDEYEGGDEDEDDDDYEEGGSTWKKVLITIIVLLVLAGGSFAFYTFKTDTINNMASQVLSSTSVLITTNTKNQSSLEVICSTPTGEVTRVPYTEDGAVFTDLNPNTTYTFTLSSTDGKLLLGSKDLEAKTKEMTNLTGFAASSVSAVSATLALSGTGPVPESWIVTLTSDSGENITAESAEIPLLVTGLTPATTYTATIAKNDGDILGGTTQCTFTTMEYTNLATFGTTDISTSSVALAWSYSGTVPDSWTVSCVGSDGTSTTQEVSGTECTLDGLVSGETYSISLDCPSLKETELSAIDVTIPSVTITGITSSANEEGDVEVSWEYTSDVEPGLWTVSYAYVTSTGEEVTPTVVETDEPNVILEDLLPNTTYTIKVTGADDLAVGGTAETTCLSGEAAKFSEYGCSDMDLTLYVLEDNVDGLKTEGYTFTTQQHIAFALEASYDVSEEEKAVSCTYVIRDAEGNPYRVYTGNRNWSGTYTVMQHKGDIPTPIEVPGEYTMEVYFNNQLMDSADFTVTE